jgi:hypothetical protein
VLTYLDVCEWAALDLHLDVLALPATLVDKHNRAEIDTALPQYYVVAQNKPSLVEQRERDVNQT